MRVKSLAIDAAIAVAAGVGSMVIVSMVQRDQGSAREKDFEDKTAHRTQQGAAAEKPQDIPATGWWDIARRTYHEMEKDRVRAVAAGVTFYALLAVFPALTV